MSRLTLSERLTYNGIEVYSKTTNIIFVVQKVKMVKIQDLCQTMIVLCIHQSAVTVCEMLGI